MTKSIYTTEMVTLRDWLKQQRLSQELTMRSLAQRMDKPHSFVQRVEDGDRRLDLVEYIWYCMALRIDPRTGLELVLQQITELSV